MRRWTVTKTWTVQADNALKAIELARPREHERVICRVQGHGLEQERRHFMEDYPELYRYITMRETAKTFDLAGDTASGAGDGHSAANRIWALAARAKAAYEAMLP